MSILSGTVKEAPVSIIKPFKLSYPLLVYVQELLQDKIERYITNDFARTGYS